MDDEVLDIITLILLACLLPLIAAFALALAAVVGVLHVVAWVCARL